MARKKVAKVTKTKKANTKSQSKSITLSAVDVMEKEFNATPAKIISQSRKDLTALKMQEKKLKSELKKAQVQKKVAKNKRVTLTTKSKAKTTATSKKLLTAAKQAYDKITLTLTEVSGRYDAIKKQTKELAAKVARFSALHKLISQFEKQWGLKAKKSSTVSKPKKTTKKTKLAPFTPNDKTSLKTTHEAPVVAEREEPVEA